MKDVLFKWIVVVLIFIFLILMFLLTRIFYNEYATDKEIKKLIKETSIEESIDGNLVSIDSNVKSDYWKYINSSSINVNFDNLKKINQEIVGWIQINGTGVNYPYVKTKNNKFYLKHSINKKSNHVGWTFEDYKVKEDSNNIILYNCSDKTILASSKDVLDKKWFKNNDHIIKTSTLFENNIWQIFSIYKTKNTDEINVNYDKLIDYLKPMVEKSIYDFNVNIDNTIKIITFITKNNNEYIVIHAKMIKQQKR